MSGFTTKTGKYKKVRGQAQPTTTTLLNLRSRTGRRKKPKNQNQMNKKIRFSLLTLLVMLCGTVFATKTVYVDPVGNGTWMGDNAKISLNVFTDGQINNAWASFTTLSDGVLKFTIEDTYDRMVIVRGENQDAWGWNQTSNITLEANKLYKANGYDNGALAYTVEDYTEPVADTSYKVDFNTTISTSSHDFAVASKWKHIVEDNDGSYVGYKWDAAYGTGNPATGGLLVYSQKVGSSSWDMATVYDLLVTPKVSGTIKLKVKVYENASSSTKAFVQLYALNGAATEKADMLKEFQTEITGYNTGSGDWVELTYDVAEAQRIGIRAQYVYIDDFYADAIDTTPEAALVVSSVMNSDGQTGTNGTNPTFEQQADGNMKVVLKVTLTNTGDVDFVAGTTENYTLTAAQASYTSYAKTYYGDASIAIPEDLAAGETKTFDVEFTVPYVSGYKYWYVKENVTGTTSTSYRYATSIAYESKFILRVAESGSTSDLTTAQDYGRVSAAETRSFEIYNDGTAPLTIKSITLPEGFTSDNLPEIPVDGLVLAKKEATDAFNVTLPVTTTGDYAGNLVIKYVKTGDTEETTKTLAFSGTALAEGTWFADFNGDKSSSTSGVYPEGGVVTSSTTLQFGSTGSYGSYDHYLKPYSSVGMFVTPKLTATAGATLKYDAVKYQSGNSYYLKVYVSTDRKTWGEPVATINNSDLETSGQRYSQTLTFDEAGDYYVAFELYGVSLDNIIGLTKTEVGHDLYLKETNLVSEAQTGSTIKPNVKVVPLTAEAADGYTVKFYVDNVAVAQGIAENLTVSATADKTFTINYTPNDEVTTEHDTYIEFEFTDGTKFATEHQTLKVTNEPKFLFVASSAYVSQYTTNLTTAQAFGKVNVTTESKNFKIYNQGTAVLKVTSIVAPEGFSVNKTEAFEVAAGESEDITVTFSTTTPGDYAGNLVVTYVQENAEPYQLAFSGTMLDPSKWYADFGTESNQWPAGSVAQSSVTTSYIGTNNYGISCYGTTNNVFVTPKLTAAAGEKLSFLASGSSSAQVKVYVADTRDHVIDKESASRTQLLYLSSSDTEADATLTSTLKTFEVTVPAAGDYYIGFEMSGSPKVDEIYGLNLVEGHDLNIISSNIPTEAMQNVISAATVNILNLGIADEAAEDITVTAYVDGKAVATVEGVDIPMNHKLTDAGTLLSVNYLSTKAGTFPVYVEVKAGEYSVATTPVDVTFAEEKPIAEAGVSGTTTNLYGPVYMADKNCETVSLYTAKILQAGGLKAGDKIKSIAFKGYNPSDETTSKFEVWYEWTDDQTLTKPTGELCTAEYVAGMTKIVDEESRTWPKMGSSSEFVNLIELDFSTNPLVYQSGKSLRIVVRNQAAAYKSKYFVTTSNNNLYYKHSSDYASYTTSSWSGSTLPAIYFELDASAATLSGTVKTSGREAIEGATVTLKAENGAEYSGTTNAEGEYSFNVIQAGLDFTATVEAENYLTKEFAYNLGGESKTLNTTLYQSYGIVGTGLTGFDWDHDKVMTQSDEDPSIFTLVVPDVVVDADKTTFEYKLRADGIWQNSETNDGYELPGSGNNEYTFAADTYTLTFTANVAEHTLELAAESNTLKQAVELAEDDDAVAVGKLRKAIEDNPANVAALRDAINQFNEDNAPLETDLTTHFTTLTDPKNWVNAIGAPTMAYAGWAAPKVHVNGTEVALVESYGEGQEFKLKTGDVMYQDITGLAPGTYAIELFGAACLTAGRSDMTTDFEEGDDNSKIGACLYAKSGEQNVKEYVPCLIESNMNKRGGEEAIPTAKLNGIIVGADGTIRVGLAKELGLTNWHFVQLKGVIAQVLAKDLYASDQNELAEILTEAKALAADENKTEGKEAFNAVIATAEEASTTKANWYNVSEIEDIIDDLKAAMDNFKKANRYIDFANDVKYYIIDAESGKMMAAGHDYGTRGIVNEMGLDLTLTAYTEGRTVTIDSRVSNGGNSHFLGENLYMDSSEWGWVFEFNGTGFYIIEPNSGKYINIDGEDNLVLSDTPREWNVLTAAEVLANRLATLDAATAENPADATFLIQSANFNRNDQRTSAWTVSEDCTNKNLNGGNGENNCAESFHSTFTIMQTISGAPAGIYKMTAQGFYRQDEYEGEAPTAPMFFANGVNGDVLPLTGIENGMSDASVSFTNGSYTIEPIEFVVKEDGMMYVGVTASTDTQWVIFDNFQLEYCGPAITISENADYDPVDGVANVILERTFSNENWNTFVVPFNIDNATLTEKFGNDVQVAEYSEVEGNDPDNVTVKFDVMASPAITANVPVLLKTSEAPASVIFCGVTVEDAEAKAEGTYFDFVGSYNAKEFVKEGNYYLSANKLYQSTSDDGTFIKGTRAYLKDKTAAGARIAYFSIGEEVTGIKVIDANNGAKENIYNLNGQKVDNVKKGLYIKNGKKVMVK